MIVLYSAQSVHSGPFDAHIATHATPEIGPGHAT